MPNYLRAHTWLSELEISLLAVDDLRTDCTGLTMIISALLSRAEIPHRCMHGSVMHMPSQSHVVPHYWIELEQDIVVDLRLRMWLGDTDDIPHGIFEKALALDLRYTGKGVSMQTLSAYDLYEITEGRSARLRLPALQ